MNFVVSGNIKGLKEYLNDGGDPNVQLKDGPKISRGETPLMQSVLSEETEMVSVLIDKINELNLNPNLAADDSRTPLDLSEYKLENNPNNSNNNIIHTMLKQSIALYKARKRLAFYKISLRDKDPLSYDLYETIHKSKASLKKKKTSRKKKKISRKKKT